MAFKCIFKQQDKLSLLKNYTRIYVNRSLTSSHYKVLKVKPNASQAEIKAAYYKLSMKYHPDINKNNKSLQMFQEITEAYNVLSNACHRQHYDKELFSPARQDSANYYRNRYKKSTVTYSQFTGTPIYKYIYENKHNFVSKGEQNLSATDTAIMNHSNKPTEIMKLNMSTTGDEKPLPDSNIVFKYIFGLTFTFLTIFFTTVSPGYYIRRTKSSTQQIDVMDHIIENFPGD